MTASADGYVRVASVESGDWKCASRPTPPLHWDGDPVEEHWINSARFSGDGKRVISAHETGWVGTWTLPTACDA